MKRIMFAVLCVIMIAGVCFAQSAATLVGLRTALLATPQVGGCVIKLKEAGIQFLVPPGWEVETDKDGVVTFSKADGNSFIVATLSTLPAEFSTLKPEEQFKATSEGLFSSAKKDLQGFKLGAVAKGTQNRMALINQSYSGKRQAIDMTGVVAILQASKPVVIFTQVTTTVSATFVEEFTKMMNSVKKIE